MMADAKLKDAQAMKAQAEAHATMAEVQRGPEGQPDQSLDVAKFQLEAQKLAQEHALKVKELELAWFEAETARLALAQSAQQAQAQMAHDNEQSERDRHFQAQSQQAQRDHESSQPQGD